MLKVINKIEQIDDERFWINSLISLFLIIIIFMFGILFDSVDKTIAPMFFIVFFISIFICLYQLINQKNKELDELKTNIDSVKEELPETKSEDKNEVEEVKEVIEIVSNDSSSEYLTEEEIKTLQGD